MSWIIIILASLLGIFMFRTYSLKKMVNRYEKLIESYSETLDTIRESKNDFNKLYESYNQYYFSIEGKNLDGSSIKEVETYDIDDILDEISKKGIQNISNEKLNFLRKHQ